MIILRFKTSLVLAIVLLCTTACSSLPSDVSRKTVIQVKVVSLEGCMATPPTIALINETAGELGLMIELQRVIVRTALEAETHRHIGSPTV